MHLSISVCCSFVLLISSHTYQSVYIINVLFIGVCGGRDCGGRGGGREGGGVVHVYMCVCFCFLLIKTGLNEMKYFNLTTLTAFAMIKECSVKAVLIKSHTVMWTCLQRFFTLWGDSWVRNVHQTTPPSRPAQQPNWASQSEWPVSCQCLQCIHQNCKQDPSVFALEYMLCRVCYERVHMFYLLRICLTVKENWNCVV